MSIYLPHTLRQWLIASGIITLVLIAAWVVDRFMPESSPVARGASYSYAVSCLECHGQPESSSPDDATLACGRTFSQTSHPEYDGNCTDLLAFFETVRVWRTFPERSTQHSLNHVMEGERLARKFYCFQCHGELGQGGYPNLGAFKGYIPGYFGRDFAYLTQAGNPESIHRWISKGVDPDLYEKPIEGTMAKYYIDRQAISMPAHYSLSETQLQVLVDYILTLNSFGKMDAKKVRAYSKLTQ